MKTYTTIPNDIGSYLIPEDVYRFTCLSFTKRVKGATDSTFKQIGDLTKDKSNRTIEYFVKRLRKSNLIRIETYQESGTKKRNRYYIPIYEENFKMIHNSIIELDLDNKLKGFLIMLSGHCINNTRECKYTQIKLAELFKMHRNTVGKYIKSLIELGYINKIKGGFEITATFIMIKTQRDIELENLKDILSTFPEEHYINKVVWDKVKNPERFFQKLISGIQFKDLDTLEQGYIIL